MGYYFELDSANKILRCTCEGVITGEILSDLYFEKKKLLETLPPCSGINDFSGVTSFDVSSETIERLANMPVVFGGATLGIVVAPKDVIFGVSRMFAMYGLQPRPNFHIVRTMDEAYKLLEIASPQFTRLYTH